MLSSHPIFLGLTTPVLTAGIAVTAIGTPTIAQAPEATAGPEAVEPTTSTESPAESTQSQNTQIQSLLTGLNQERVQAGLSAVELQPQLMDAAQAHATDMATQDFFAPEGSDGSDAAARVARTGYSQRPIAENLGASKADAPEILQDWLESADARAKLLNPDYQDVGIGYASNPNSELDHYWVVVLGVGATTVRESAEETTARASEPDVAQTLLALTNQARQQACLPLFATHPSLTTVAQTEAAAIAAGQVPASSGLLQERLAKSQYFTSVLTLLQALEATTPSAAWAQWQAQGASLKLNPLQGSSQTEVGFGVETAPGSDRQFWTMVLAQPPATTIIPPTVEPFLQEQGNLEPGVDPVLPLDGSTYDLYSFEADAGQTITVTLNSSTFDTYLFLFNSSNVQIADNDDISSEDSNSQLQITLPCDGEYKVMVNSYDPESEGEYNLSIYNSP